MKVFIDGSSRGNPGPAGAGVFIIEDNGSTHTIQTYLGEKTNNQAEYLALIEALTEIPPSSVLSKLEIYSDSMLLVQQINGKWKVKNTEIRLLHKQAKALLLNYKSPRGISLWSLAHIGRKFNAEADRLAGEASDDSPLWNNIS